MSKLSTTPDGLMLTDAQLEILRHMLGARPYDKKRNWGHRNYFNAEKDHDDMKTLLELHELGLIIPGAPGYWHCTVPGCEAAGLNKAQTRRAIHGD